MVTFVIFGAAILAVLFFVFGVIFKAIASALNATLSSGGNILCLGAVAVVVAIVLEVVGEIIDDIVRNGFWSALGSIIIVVIVIGVLGSLFGGIGAVLFEIIVTVVALLFELASNTLELLADKCEKGYVKSLKVIINRLDRS